MIASLKELYSLLTAEQRKKLAQLQVLVILMSIAEVASVFAIGPFMALVGNIDQLSGDGIIAQIYDWTGLTNTTHFLILVGIFALLALTVSALLSTLTIWRLSMYGSRVGAELSNRLYMYYMHQPWLYHASGNSSHLINKISNESARVTNGIIGPLMQVNARLVMALTMAVAVFIYNPIVAVTGVILFGGAYAFLFAVVRARVHRNGLAVSKQQTRRLKLMSEGFGGIKDVLLLGRQSHFTDRFSSASYSYARATGNNSVLSSAPRFILELVAFGAVIFLVLALLLSNNGDMGRILPAISVYALAGFKLLPAFQQVYSSLTSIKGSMPALDNIKDELRLSSNLSFKNETASEDSQCFTRSPEIGLRDVSFSYSTAAANVVNGVSLTIAANTVVGFVGASGSGKSTLIDILMGLIQPNEGTVVIDGNPLTKENLRAWQNQIGFVAQSIYLADASIRDNVAFGLPQDLIEQDKVDAAIKTAHLQELVQSLPQGLDTIVGERGVQLSGGQRQRIGIARALYHNAQVLIFDEATSALDGITEKLIMDAIHDFAGSKTIVLIAHRLATVKKCDRIYLMEEGKVAAQGTFEELVHENATFKVMSELA
ncbi:MAG: ATP-binding cassette domain-containing protein [Halioglobus sp.]